MCGIVASTQRIALFVFVLISWAAVALISWARAIEIDYMSFAPFWGVGLVFYFAAALLVLIKDQYVSAVCEILGALFLLVVPIFLSTFLAISLRMPLADDWLIAADRAIGFDWVAYIHFIDQYLFLIQFFTAIYDVFFILILAVPLLLIFSRKVELAFGFVFGFEFLSLFSSVISIWFPSMGAFYSYGVPASELEHMVPTIGYGFLEQFQIAYGGHLQSISVVNLSGILSFPSVHAGVGFWVFWSARKVKWARWPVCFSALAMALSAISHGSHYFVDILAGLGVAIVTGWVTSNCFLAQWSLPSFGTVLHKLGLREVNEPKSAPNLVDSDVLQAEPSVPIHKEQSA